MDRNLYLNCVCGRQKIVDNPKVTHREGVIEGLEKALLKLDNIMCAHESNTYDAAWNGALDRAADAIRIEIERLRNES